MFTLFGTIPTWAFIVLWVLGIGFAITAVIALAAFIVAMRNGAFRPSQCRKRLLVTLLAALAAVWCIGTVLCTPRVDPPKEDLSAAGNQEPEPSAPAGDELPDDAFVIDLDDEQLIAWLQSEIGEEGESTDAFLKRLAMSVDYSSMPAQRDERNAAILEVCRLTDPKSEGFQDGVSMPYDKVVEAYYVFKTDTKAGTKAWKDLTIEERETFLDENFRGTFIFRTITNVPYGDMLASGLEYHNDSFPIIGERNPWLLEGLAKTDAAMESGEGLMVWFNPRTSWEDVRTLKDEWIMFAAKVAYLYGGYGYAVPPIQTLTSDVTWHLPMVAEAKFCRTECTADPKAQDNRASVMLVMNYKSGSSAIRDGINLADGRLSIYNPTAPVSEPEPEETPAPTETPTPTQKPTPTPAPSYTLTVQFVDENGNKLSTDVTEKHKAGEQYNVPAKSIPDYVPNRSAATGTMPAKDHVEQIVYAKTTTQPTKATLRINYFYGGTTTEVFSPHIEELTVGSWFSVISPTKEGYTADQTVVQGTLPSNGTVINVYYWATTYKLTIHYVYKDTNRTAAPDNVSTHKANEWYAVDSPVISGYVADKTVVSGYMPSKDLEVTVYYVKPVHTLTIYYRYEDTGGTAAPTYTATLKEGQTYSRTSPTVSGYHPDQLVVSGTMGKYDITVTVWYIKNLPDGQGGKNPDDSTSNNPDHPGGDNDDPGPGEEQPTKPTVEDVPAQTDPNQTTSGPDGAGTNNTASSDKRQEETGQSVSATDDVPTSGTGGADPSQVTDPNGGTTFGGDTPDKSPITAVDNTTATDSSGNTTNTGDLPAGGEFQMPD